MMRMCLAPILSDASGRDLRDASTAINGHFDESERVVSMDGLDTCMLHSSALEPLDTDPSIDEFPGDRTTVIRR